jgi:hypothetical protein
MLTPTGIIESTALGNAWRVGRRSFLRKIGIPGGGWTHLKLGMLVSWPVQTAFTAATDIGNTTTTNTRFAFGMCNASRGPWQHSSTNSTLHFLGFAPITPLPVYTATVFASDSGRAAAPGRVDVAYTKGGTQVITGASPVNPFVKSDCLSLIGIEVKRNAPNWIVRFTYRTAASTSAVTLTDFQNWLVDDTGLVAPANHTILARLSSFPDATIDEAANGTLDAFTFYCDRAYNPLLVHNIAVQNLNPLA